MDEGETEQPTIVGYAAMFDRRSFDLGGFTEIIKPGAFASTLAGKPDVRALVNHESGLMTIGRTTNGTLQLVEDEIGLRVKILPPDTQAGRDVVTLVKRGDLSQMSFAFYTKVDNWLQDANGAITRELIEVSIDNGDVSIVTYPAYGDTLVQARSLNIPEIPTTLVRANQGADFDKEQRALLRKKLQLIKHS